MCCDGLEAAPSVLADSFARFRRRGLGVCWPFHWLDRGGATDDDPPCPLRLPFACSPLLAANLAVAAQVDDATAVTMAAPHELIVAGDITPAQREAILTPINNLYGFWNNGSPELLKQGAVARVLRPRVAARPAARVRRARRPASKGFLAAVPDLVVTVVQQLVVAVDRVVSQVRLTGPLHRQAGRRGKGKGQAIDFTGHRHPAREAAAR